jgi:hypothetical protein
MVFKIASRTPESSSLHNSIKHGNSNDTQSDELLKNYKNLENLNFRVFFFTLMIEQ